MINTIKYPSLNRKVLALSVALALSTPILANNFCKQNPEMVQDTIELSGTTKMQEMAIVNDKDTTQHAHKKKKLSSILLSAGLAIVGLGLTAMGIGFVKSSNI